MLGMFSMRSASNAKAGVLKHIAVESLCVKLEELVRRIVAFSSSHANVVDTVVTASVLLAEATDSRGKSQVGCTSSRNPPVFSHD